MATKGLVLVTGANGFIAARTVESFLLAGYSVRGTVRSEKSAETILAALSEYVRRGQFEVVQVPDITASGAFDSAVKGTTAIAHLATPVSTTNTDVDEVINTAVNGTLSVAESALKEPGIKSLVLMSSIAAVRSFTNVGTFTEDNWNTEIEALVKEKGPEAGGFAIYGASKVAAERAFWKWVQDKKPQFSATALCPVWVAGPPLTLPESPANISLTNEFIWKVFSGEEYPPGPVGYGAHVDLRDVGRMAVFGVEHPEIANGQRYIVGGNGNFGNPQATADLLRKLYPERRHTIKEGTPGEGYVPGWGFLPGGIKIVSDKAVKATGQDWIPYDKMVLDTAKMFEAFL